MDKNAQLRDETLDMADEDESDMSSSLLSGYQARYLATLHRYRRWCSSDSGQTPGPGSRVGADLEQFRHNRRVGAPVVDHTRR